MNKTIMRNRRAPWLLLLLLGLRPSPAAVETRRLTLEEAVELALRQNPEHLLARLEEQKARQAAREARSPFLPRLAAGSGLAYSSGFPLSVEGAAPSILQAQGAQYIINRPQSFRIREADEMAAAAALSSGSKAEEIAFRVAAVYLDFERAARAVAAAARPPEILARLEGLVEARVQEGREIPLTQRRARLETARARSRLEELRAHAELLEETLRGYLALGDAVRITPVESGVATRGALPESPEAAASAALASSGEVRRLETVQRAKGYQIQAEKGARYPRMDLVAQYALLGRFNNYEDFFRTFKRHNGQIGVSFQLPLFNGSQVAPRVAQAETEQAQARIRLEAARTAVAVEARRLFRQVRQAETARDLARLELDVARETLSVLLARLDEGRASAGEVEQARLVEFQKWELFYDSQTAVEAAKLGLLRQTGGLLAALGVRL